MDREGLYEALSGPNRHRSGRRRDGEGRGAALDVELGEDAPRRGLVVRHKAGEQGVRQCAPC